MWVIASIPLWILGALCFVGAIANIKWRERTTNEEAIAFFKAMLMSAAFLALAAKVSGAA